MRAVVTLILCLLGGLTVQGNQEERTAQATPNPVDQAVMPRQYITPTIGQLETGERGWINSKALVVDDRYRCWLIKDAHVHDNEADAGSAIEVARTRGGWQVTVHREYKWKTVPEAGLASDCFAVQSLTFATKDQGKK